MVQEITPKVLVVDDQPDILEAMRLLLKGGGYTTETVSSPELALLAAASGSHDLVLIDMNYARDTTSGLEGLALLDMLHAQMPEVPVIVMTAWSTIDLAVDAMRRGATDFITKPWDNERVLSLVARQTARRNELSIAHRVQRRLLPRPRFSVSGIDCECVFRPAGEIGGDLCDVFETGPDSAAFLLGDVSGKGIGAAMLMANLHGTIRSNHDLACEPARLITRVNRLFFQSTSPEHYATLFFGCYNSGTRTLRYVNCGHPPAVLLRSNSEVERLEPTGLVLGAFDGAVFEERTVQMSAGDRIVLFSDGVSEARPDDDDSWVVECIRMLGRAGSKSLAQSLAMAAVSTDDVTVLDLRF
ncbi:MAG: phosphoserine phosphatase RsbU/P [Bryobacterales bacterium]|nr:phosphoserine phosphatase RsbU/P [Bryobacterales bacterium]